MQLAGSVARAVRRRLNWDTVGIAVGVAVFAAACYALMHLLRDIDLVKVEAALRATPLHAVAAAVLLIAASYATLTFYDFFALRTIGKNHVPYRVAGGTGVLAYTFGHNLGATVFTGGAVRYRIYKAWDLTLIDVAKIAFVTGLTFWLGNAFMLGIGVAWVPEAASAINHLPVWANRALALAVLAAIGAYLLWLMPAPRSIGRDGWKITLPSAKLTVVQIGIGIADLSLAALAMVALLLPHADVDIVPLIVTFVFASLLGFVSHAPGSLGVFDAALLYGLPYIEKEVVLAALLIFRFLYFVVPFCIAIVVFGLRELRLATKS